MTSLDEIEREGGSCFSRKRLSPARRNYTAIDRELLALISLPGNFRFCLERSQFEIITDNQLLNFLFGSPKIRKRKAI